MKKLLTLTLAALLVTASAAAETRYTGNVTADADVLEVTRGIAVTAWTMDDFDDGNGVTEAAALRITYTGPGYTFELTDGYEAAAADEAAEHAWNDCKVGEITLYKPANEDIIRWVYTGTNGEEDNGDHEFVDYDSYYSDYQDGQLRRVYYHPENSLEVLLKFYFNEPVTQSGVRVEWLEDTAEWRLTRFAADTARDAFECQIAARYGYYDQCGGYEVRTESSGLNIRSAPGGEKIGSAKKGSTLTVFGCELPAENMDGKLFTLVGKYTEPNEDGVRYLEYYGWVASEYIGEAEDWVWTLAEGK